MTLQKKITHSNLPTSQKMENQSPIIVSKEILFNLDLKKEEIELLLQLLKNNDQIVLLEKMSCALNHQNIPIEISNIPIRYSDFTLQQVFADFNLNSEPAPLFEDIPLIPTLKGVGGC